MPPLTQIASELLKQARRTGVNRFVELPKGARIAFRVESREGVEIITFSISRKGAQVGAPEEVTFRWAAGVPATATRHPAAPEQQRIERDGQIYYRVLYRWGQALP